MLKDMTLGQFFPGNSVIHRLDPRTKVILTIVYIVTIFLAHSVWCYAALVLSSLLLVWTSGISLRVVLRGIRPILFVLLFTMLINLFWTTGDTLLFEFQLIPIWKFTTIRLYTEGIQRAVVMAVRVVVLIIGSSVLLTYTTSPITLTDALESLLSPLRVLRVPVHEFAMMMTIALRFIPTLVEETSRIMNAQRARGADFSSGGLIKRAKALIPVLVPLFVSAFKRAEELATAMECRCYRGGKGRTKLHKLTFRLRDLWAFLLFAAFLTGIVFGNIYFPILIPFGFFCLILP